MPPAKREHGLRPKRMPVWLILGPSGTGKSSFGEWLAAKQNWLHLEIDQYPKDGITLYNLRAEWVDFYENGNPNGFAEALQHHLKAAAKARAVLTFPGNLVLCPDRVIAASQAGLRTIYLYASADYCITAFLNREQQNGRNLDLVHWSSNNSRSYIQMSDPAFAPYRIHVFTSTGTRRRHNAVFKAVVADGRSE